MGDKLELQLKDGGCSFELPIPWAVLEVRGTNEEDIFFVKAGSRFLSIMGISGEIEGRAFSDFAVMEKKLAGQFYRAAFEGEEIHDRLQVGNQELWIDYAAAPVGREGYCFYTFHDIHAIKEEHRQAVRSWNTDEVAMDCIRLLRSHEKVGRTMEIVLEKIGQEIQADRVYVLRAGESRDGMVRVLYEYSREGTDSARQTFRSMTNHMLEDWEVLAKDGDGTVIKNLESIRMINPVAYSQLLKYGIRTIIEFPLLVNNRLEGYLGADNFKENEMLNIRNLMATLSYFIASEMENRRLLEQLDQMSKTDLLTGVNNRNAMNQKIEELEARHGQAGIFYVDVNGLKHVNDTMGHKAGDMLIRCMADVLKEVFGREEIYRAGGDEFVVLAEGLDEAGLQSKKEGLDRRLASGRELSFAVGCQWCPDVAGIRGALAEADKAMYQNKAEHYLKKER